MLTDACATLPLVSSAGASTVIGCAPRYYVVDRGSLARSIVSHELRARIVVLWHLWRAARRGGVIRAATPFLWFLTFRPPAARPRIVNFPRRPNCRFETPPRVCFLTQMRPSGRAKDAIGVRDAVGGPLFAFGALHEPQRLVGMTIGLAITACGKTQNARLTAFGWRHRPRPHASRARASARARRRRDGRVGVHTRTRRRLPPPSTSWCKAGAQYRSATS